jgi:dipeptidyl-peptidase-4
LVIGDKPVTPPGLQVRAVSSVNEGGDVLFLASSEPAEQRLCAVFAPDYGECVPLTTSSGIHSGVGASDVFVVARASLGHDGVETAVFKNGERVGVIKSFGEPAPFEPRVSISRQGSHELRTALVLPRDHVPGSARLPVLMDPYGGPHAQRVLASRGAYLTSQWLADQGFAVVVVDGRGTPGRGAAWERAIAGDLATPVLADQIDALHALADANRDLDLTRVAIRGWSFGGYLAALAVLRRPDVFHAAVAGAPVTDWRLYDTYYTERYLGVDASAATYDASSLIDDAPSLTRPLLIVHGLADDNVVAAHTLRLSTELLAAGRPHSVLPLSGVTHMTTQESVAANLLSLEVAFLRRSLGIA